MEVGVSLFFFFFFLVSSLKKGKKKTQTFSKMKFLKTRFKLGIVQKFKEQGFERYFHWDNTVVSCIINSVDDWCCEKDGKKRVYAPIIHQNHVSK